jgi:hypothetical protein
VVLCGFMWFYVVLCGFMWFYVVLCGFMWFYVVLCGFVWFCVVFGFAFSYLFPETAANENLSGLQFFVDGIQDHMVQYHPIEDTPLNFVYPNLQKGKHSLMWVFHQPHGTTRRKRVVLSDIVIEGSDVGGAVKTVACERGSFSKHASPKLCELCPPGSVSIVGSSGCTRCEAGYFAQNWGTAQCEACGVAIASNEARTGCDTQGCVFQNEMVVFNLSSLDYLVDLVAKTRVYKISLCQKLTQVAQCYDNQNQVIDNAHICEVDLSNGVGRSVGNTLNVAFSPTLFDENENENENENEGRLKTKIPQLRLTYTHGERCVMDTHLKTEITFVCDTHKTGFSDPVFVGMQSQCVLKFEWPHLASCRLCDYDSDYESRQNECENGVQEVITVRKTKCNGPLVLARSVNECTRTLAITLPAAFALFGLFVFLLFFVLMFVVRNKQISDDYDLLVNAQAGREDE